MKLSRILILAAVVLAMVMSTGCFVDYMKITLEWTTNADLDLAVAEPDGTVYLNPAGYGSGVPVSVNGKFGDDVTTFGTETYTLNLASHENGDYYAVVVNNESYPVNCIVKITSGFKTETYPVTVSGYEPTISNSGIYVVDAPATIKLIQRELLHKTK